ncbi:MAG: pilus assembly PilX N-terminal domain-containing protein [bacterium]
MPFNCFLFTAHSSLKRGMALITVLWLSVILLILGLSFLNLLSADYYFAGRQKMSIQAFYLAQSGMEYFKATGKLSEKLSIPPSNNNQLCRIQRDEATGDLIFKGIISGTDNKIIAQRIIIAPGGDLEKWYEK